MAISASTQQMPPAPRSPKKSDKLPFLFQVRALYDFNPTESGELLLKRGDIVNVHDHTTYPDWWKGAIDGEIGIFPANYVEKIESNAQNTTGSQQPFKDTTSNILNQSKFIAELQQNIAKADPLGHNFSENERLKVERINTGGLSKCSGTSSNCFEACQSTAQRTR